MEENSYNVIGVMSGTSLDGVDCAYVRISKNEPYKAVILQAKTYPYPLVWENRLAGGHDLSKDELGELNIEYTRYLSQIINRFVSDFELQEIDAVCSHGHTILHQPNLGFTLQIGNLPELASLTNLRVVCDFRVQDVELGGQGAPLVPIGDELLFNQYEYCLNLGGFANVSTNKEGTRIAYDICPVNVVLNTYAQLLGAAYDDEGAFAKAGTVHTTFLSTLNILSYYSESPPKSLGIEWVHEHIFPLIDRFEISPKDVLATFTEHIAIQLSYQFKKGSTVLITGGGAYNKFLIERLIFHKNVEVIVPEAKLLEFKEALIFALLGVLRLENNINVLSSVTGASKDHCSGVIYRK